MSDAPGITSRRGLSRRLFTGGAAAAAVGPLALTTSAAAKAPKAPSGGVKTATAGGTVRHLKLYAEKLPDGQMGYGLEKGKASVPGPLIELTEGDTLHIEFENTMDVTASLHVHGLDYDVASDGTQLNRSAVEPGGTRTYTWRTHAPGKRADGTWRPGSAGYWHYHDHAVGTPHGTGGLRKGLYGPVVVRRAGDILPDKQFTIVFNDMTINNKAGHDAPEFRATVGDRVEIIMITHGEYYHTFHMHGHRWADNRTGLLAGPDDVSRVIDNKITGPADSFGFQVIAGENVGAGAWMYHCHVQSHSDMGMAGLFLVAKADGTIPGYDEHRMSTHHPG
ncbi:multicopper oxidase domain-containing protein [Streptomyces rugosispiralis]|uniref:Multicopper oxidase domain-containing protein n=1 Tax=Streptomyces rugosispiralis TaxID=2967341 RepID=A0ABT1UUY6_9ACTN|nr:multicopper oxidase domain-containing protein [Streptomyces rugosispiralis]MCQ8188429.1 multicopper oxidase domain-containing protein [Streptomyces rugosispiralis]